MKAWTEWETIRRQVAIGCRVLDERDRPVTGAEVTITGGSGDGRPEGPGRRDRCVRAKPGGIYYVLDLPAGTYTVKGTDSRSRAACEQAVAVSWDTDGKVRMAVADLRFSDTARPG